MVFRVEKEHLSSENVLNKLFVGGELKVSRYKVSQLAQD